jgi:DNA-directed RNA polymerase specialized sigma24 family protein
MTGRDEKSFEQTTVEQFARVYGCGLWEYQGTCYSDRRRDVSDAEQECWLATLTAQKTFDPARGDYKNHVELTVKNHIRNAGRRAYRRKRFAAQNPEGLEAHTDNSDLSVFQQVVWNDTWDRLNREMRKPHFSDRDRRIVKLYHTYAGDQTDVAADLNCNDITRDLDRIRSLLPKDLQCLLLKPKAEKTRQTPVSKSSAA